MISSCLLAESDPFSKIKVASKRAVFKRDKNKKKVACMRYLNDVKVEFADGTIIKADFLELFLKTDKKNVERVLFKKGVCMNRVNQTIHADEIEVEVDAKTCDLRGNVEFNQVKNKDGDIPLTTKCEHAKLRWDCDEIELVGSDVHPVCTKIDLSQRARGKK